MALIKSSTILEFVDVQNFRKFKIIYLSANGHTLESPRYFSIDELEDAAKARLMKRINERISSAKRDA